VSALVTSLETAIRDHCVTAMQAHREDDVSGLSSFHLVAEYASWRARFPTDRRRTIHESDLMVGDDRRELYVEGLSAIYRDIREGHSLDRYLSSLVRFADGRDLLLAHAGIHHLHMSNGAGQHGRVMRTPEVVFVAFQPTDAYVIGIWGHESDGANWSERAILETIIRNWPDAGILFRSGFATGLVTDFGDAERQTLRRAGLNLAIEVDGAVWSSLGATATGAPLVASRMGMKVHWDLHGLRQHGDSAVLADLQAATDHKPPPTDWTPVVHQEDYGFYSESAELFVRYGSLVAG
jgi:hypothetical protein